MNSGRIQGRTMTPLLIKLFFTINLNKPVRLSWQVYLYNLPRIGMSVLDYLFMSRPRNMANYKTSAEIELMRHSCTIVEKAIAEVAKNA
jgi:hypothetical protein